MAHVPEFATSIIVDCLVVGNDAILLVPDIRCLTTTTKVTKSTKKSKKGAVDRTNRQLFREIVEDNPSCPSCSSW